MEVVVEDVAGEGERAVAAVVEALQAAVTATRRAVVLRCPLVAVVVVVVVAVAEVGAEQCAPSPLELVRVSVQRRTA